MLRTQKTAFGAKAAFVVSALAIFAVAAIAASPAEADTDYKDAYISVEGGVYNGDYGLYGTPGEAVKWTFEAAKTTYWDTSSGEDVAIEGLTYTWTCDAKLKAKVKGAKAIIKKLPSKAGSYKLGVVAKDENGKTVSSWKNKIVVKKKPSISITVRTQGKNGAFAGNKKTVKKSDRVMFLMDGAAFGWSNNSKKPFYTWTVKDTKTGKTATWTKKGNFKSNGIIGGGSVAGGGCPTFTGEFKKTGTFKITATVYHSNKQIATATKTVKVK